MSLQYNAFSNQLNVSLISQTSNVDINSAGVKLADSAPMIIGYASIVTTGLKLHLDAGNSNSYSGSGTTWTDLSGNGNNATLINGPTYSSADSGSIVFDGTNDYATVSSLDLPDRPFAINVWVRHESNLDNWQSYMGQNTSNSGNLGALYFQKKHHQNSNANTLSIAIRPDGSSGDARVDSSAALTLNTWTNLCAVVSSSEMKLYINGASDGTLSNSSTMAPRSGDLIIGASYWNNTLYDYFKGKMSAIYVYDRALSAEEVSQNFNALKSRYGL